MTTISPDDFDDARDRINGLANAIVGLCNGSGADYSEIMSAIPMALCSVTAAMLYDKDDLLVDSITLELINRIMEGIPDMVDRLREIKKEGGE